ncbi:MAG: hypothetical protein IKF38_00895 [Clostridia bacterium]|nr:hypothetical protein [Clostridia bacterium]
MSELELSSLKYQPLEKLGNLANKAQNNADGVEQLIKVLPSFEQKTNEVMEEKNIYKEETVQVSAKPSNNANRPFFTGNGKAEQAVRQRTASAVKTRSTSNDER